MQPSIIGPDQPAEQEPTGRPGDPHVAVERMRKFARVEPLAPYFVARAIIASTPATVTATKPAAGFGGTTSAVWRGV